MKTKQEIEQLAFLEYPRVINDPYNPMEDDNTYERKIWIGAYTQCQEDMADKPKQETLEEAAEKYINTKNPQWTPYHRKSFEDGAKWQQTNSDKKYTEMQLRDAMEDAMCFSKLKQITEYINLLNKQD